MQKTFIQSKLSSDKAKEEQKEMVIKTDELEKRSNSSRLKDDNREKMKNVSKNARDIYNFGNKIINSIKKERGEDVEDIKNVEYAKESIIHRPEKDIENLINSIKLDNEMHNDESKKYIKENLLEFLNNIKNIEILNINI